jgi:hypothetical protein
MPLKPPPSMQPGLLPQMMEPLRQLHGQANFVKLSFARLLQEAFSDDSIPKEYRWRPHALDRIPGVKTEQGQRQLWIYRANPNRETGLPAIFIESDLADCSIAQLGQEIMRQLKDKDQNVVGYVFAGPVFIPVKITIVGKTTTDREILTAWTNDLVRYAFRPVFLANKIEYLDIRSGDAGEEGETPADRRFFGTVEIHCQTQSSRTIALSLWNRIQSVNLDGIKYGTTAADLTPFPG